MESTKTNTVHFFRRSYNSGFRFFGGFQFGGFQSLKDLKIINQAIPSRKTTMERKMKLRLAMPRIRFFLFADKPSAYCLICMH